MVEQTHEAKFTGRYGEVIKNLREIKPSSPERARHLDFMLMTGTGIDKEGNERLVIFEVSKSTHKKNGKYFISSNGRLPITYNTILLACEYKNDLLEGKEYVHGNGKQEINLWHSGERVIPEEVLSKINEVSQVLSNPSVINAVQVGDPKKIKNAVRQVIIGTTHKQNTKEIE